MLSSLSRVVEPKANDKVEAKASNTTDESPIVIEAPPGRPPHILVVDDNSAIQELLEAFLTSQGYRVTTAGSGRQAIEWLEKEPYDLVVTDIKMAGIDGMKLLEHIMQNHRDTAVIMATSVSDIGTAVQAMRMGAFDYVLKPFNVDDLMISVQRALERRELLNRMRMYQEQLESRVLVQTVELRQTLGKLDEAYQTTLEALVNALDAREHETHCHSKRVMRYTLLLARRVGIAEDRLLDLGRGALLHDIGKIGVSDNILLKPGRLEGEEWVQMRRHPEIGFQILKGIGFLSPACDIVLAHQERFDGSGYPRGLVGEQIPLGARVFAIVDTMDSMTSDRPYRKALSYEAARREIERYAGAQFDPAIAKEFLKIPVEEWIAIRRDVGEAK